MHGGTVVASSEGEGLGSEFIVRLPLASPPRSTVPPPRGSRGLRLPRGARVAIIEDNVDSREMLCEALTFAGFECKSADSGPDGLALVMSMLPDAAIVDVGLPDMDGFELARRIREHRPCANVQLIALTGYGQREDRQRALDAGFNVHLVKPIEPLQLVKLLTGEALSLP